MRTLKFVLPLVFSFLGFTAFAQIEEMPTGAAGGEGSIFEQIGRDISLTDAEVQVLQDKMLNYMVSLSRVVDKHDKDEADPMAIYRDVRDAKENYYTDLGTSFSPEQVTAYKGVESNYDESVNLVVGYLRVLGLAERVGLNEEQQANIITAMQEPVIKMTAVHAVVDYIIDYMNEDVLSELKEGLKKGRDYEKEELKKVLTLSQYEQWLNS